MCGLKETYKILTTLIFNLAVSITDWLKRRAGKQGVADLISGIGTYFNFAFFRLLPTAHSSSKPIQMESSMTFVQSNGYKEIYLILDKYGDCLYDD